MLCLSSSFGYLTITSPIFLYLLCFLPQFLCGLLYAFPQLTSSDFLWILLFPSSIPSLPLPLPILFLIFTCLRPVPSILIRIPVSILLLLVLFFLFPFLLFYFSFFPALGFLYIDSWFHLCCSLNSASLSFFFPLLSGRTCIGFPCGLLLFVLLLNACLICSCRLLTLASLPRSLVSNWLRRSPNFQIAGPC